MQNDHVELLAPAGNPEGFYGAIHAGADAVYLGGSRFGARAYADNFTTEELIDCIRYAHLWGRRVYLTVNTLVKESEFQDIYDYIAPFYEAGLDGVIVQDIGVLTYVREHFPDMELHASTQMTLTGVYGAEMLQKMGVCRIVPARELSLKEISYIKESTGLSMETFVHGAMCYCYSGQCLFSSILGGRSGNRGRCAQPCRLPYHVKVGEKMSGECYPLSLKDMCTVEHIPELVEAGIDSFKIEGRMKKPEYSAGVTAIYRKYIDKYYELKQQGKVAGYKVEQADWKALSSLYIRSEKQDGYYYKHNGKDMITLDNPAYSGSDENLIARIRRDYMENKPKKQIKIYADFSTGQKAMVTLMSDDISVVAEGDIVQTAAKQPISEENIAKQLCKLGDSIFVAADTDIIVSADAFYPLRAINELRRQAVQQLEDALIQKNGFPISRQSNPKRESCVDGVAHTQEAQICLSVRNAEQLTTIADWLNDKHAWKNKIARIYIDGDLLINNYDKTVEQCRILAETSEVIISLPYIIRKQDYQSVEQQMLQVQEHYPDIFAGVQVRSMEGMGILKSKKYQGKIYTDTGFYIWNRCNLQEWSGSVAGVCLPLELRAAEQKELLNTQGRNDLSFEKIVYGRIPMMITANCVANSTVGCQKGSGNRKVELFDRYQKKFPVEINCTHCMNIIYNSVPLSLHGELSKWKNRTDFRLDFTVENASETEEILNYFMNLAEAEYNSSVKPGYRDYTTGHEKRGVE